MPVLEDPSAYGYYRQEGAGLMVGLFEPKCAPWKVEGAPTDVPFADLEPDWERMGPYLETAMARVPITDAGRHEEVLLRTGELHARPAADRRRGAEPARLFRRGGPQFDRHPDGRRARPRDGALDRPRPARRRRHRDEHQSRAAVPGEPGVSPRAHGRVARHGLQVPLPVQVARDGARRTTLAVPRPARGARRVLRRDERLGIAGLVRRRRRDAGARARCRGSASSGGRTGNASIAPRAKAWSPWTCRSWASSWCRDATRASA